MRLSTPAFMLSLSLAATVQADRWVISSICFFTSCSNQGTWYYNDGRSFDVNFNEGCRAPFIPGVKEVCMDWGNSRAHFYGDSGRRACMREVESEIEQCGDWNSCITSWWEDTNCSW